MWTKADADYLPPPSTPTGWREADADWERWTEAAMERPRKRVQCKHLEAGMVLQAVRDSHGLPGVFPYDLLPGFPPRVVLRKMEKLVRRGLLEYGVSLRTAWLTEAGTAYLDG